MYKIFFSRPAKKDLKKLLAGVLNILEQKIFPKISNDPHIGEILHGSFRKFIKYKFSYQSISYRIVYEIVSSKIIILLMIGTRENFYKELKKRIK